MVDVANVYLNNSPPFRENNVTKNDSGTNIDAHYSDSMKVKRPKIKPEDIKIIIPEQTLYSDKEATRKIQQLNSDVYEAHKKEKSTNEFNFKTYFKIIAAFIGAAAGIACIRKIIGLFRK